CPYTLPHPPRPTLFPYTTLFRSLVVQLGGGPRLDLAPARSRERQRRGACWQHEPGDRQPPVRAPASHPSSCQGQLRAERQAWSRSEEHTSELQSPYDLVCRLLLE